MSPVHAQFKFEIQAWLCSKAAGEFIETYGTQLLDTYVMVMASIYVMYIT